jgi:hypothetical protein
MNLSSVRASLVQSVKIILTDIIKNGDINQEKIKWEKD